MERGGAALVVETDAPVSFSVACVGGASKSASTELTAWLSFLGEHDKHLPARRCTSCGWKVIQSFITNRGPNGPHWLPRVRVHRG